MPTRFSNDVTLKVVGVANRPGASGNISTVPIRNLNGSSKKNKYSKSINPENRNAMINAGLTKYPSSNPNIEDENKANTRKTKNASSPNKWLEYGTSYMRQNRNHRPSFGTRFATFKPAANGLGYSVASPSEKSIRNSNIARKFAEGIHEKQLRPEKGGYSKHKTQKKRNRKTRRR
jgi:hypothetical protein